MTMGALESALVFNVARTISGSKSRPPPQKKLKVSWNLEVFETLRHKCPQSAFRYISFRTNRISRNIVRCPNRISDQALVLQRRTGRDEEVTIASRAIITLHMMYGQPPANSLHFLITRSCGGLSLPSIDKRYREASEQK